MTQLVRTNYGASLSPDATAFAHLVDDGGYPRAVQRFLRGWRASSSRDVELPIEGPVNRVMHSADGYWLACEVAPEGGTRSQIWVVTTDPDDRAARRIDVWPPGLPEGTAELIGWDGVQVAAILTGDDGVGSSCLIDPADGTTTILDRRSGGRLVDAWAGAALVRVGPRGYRDLIMLRGLTEIALLPYDPGSTTDTGVILDDQGPRRLRSGLEGEYFELYQPAKFYGANSTNGYVRALIRSENGADHARLLEVTTTADGVSYQVVAERPGYELDEFAVSDDLSTVALLWNINGTSELQILEYADYTLHEPIPLPGMVASELSISAGGSMVAMTVEGPDKPRTVELVDPRTREWERIDREPSIGPLSAAPTLETITARDGLNFTGWLFRPPAGVDSIGAMIFLHGGPEGQGRPGYNEFFPPLLEAGITVFLPNVRGSGGFGRSFMHADDKEQRFAAIDDVADAALFLVERGLVPRRPCHVLRVVIRRIPDPGSAHLSSTAFRRRHQHLRHERLEHLVSQHRGVDRGGGLLQVRPPGERPRTSRPVVTSAPRARNDRTPAARPRTQRHQCPAERVPADVRRFAGAGPHGRATAVRRRRPRARQAREPSRAGQSHV